MPAQRMNKGNASEEVAVIRIVKAGERELQPLNLRGINVRACDPIPGPANCISAGFGEYVEPRRLDWTFDYHEVFFMLEGAPKIHVPGEEPVRFEPGGRPRLHRKRHPDHHCRARARLLPPRHQPRPAGVEAGLRTISSLCSVLSLLPCQVHSLFGPARPSSCFVALRVLNGQTLSSLAFLPFHLQPSSAVPIRERKESP